MTLTSPSRPNQSTLMGGKYRLIPSHCSFSGPTRSRPTVVGSKMIQIAYVQRYGMMVYLSKMVNSFKFFPTLHFTARSRF